MSLRKHPGENPDPNRYILVKTREGYVYRSKRGSKKPAKLNNTFQANADKIRFVSPAAKKFLSRLKPFMQGLSTGRYQSHFSGCLLTSLNRTGYIDYNLLKGFDFQKNYHPFGQLYEGAFQLREQKDELQVTLSLFTGCVKQLNALISNFYFEIILISGDPLKEEELRLDATTSELYIIDKLPRNDRLTLSLQKPLRPGPWIVFLKLNCMEGDSVAWNSRHYGLVVAGTGKVD